MLLADVFTDLPSHQAGRDDLIGNSGPDAHGSERHHGVAAVAVVVLGDAGAVMAEFDPLRCKSCQSRIVRRDVLERVVAVEFVAVAATAAAALPAPLRPPDRLADCVGLEIVAQVEEVTVGYFDAVWPAANVAVVERLRQREALARDSTAEQAVDPCDEVRALLRRVVLRQWQQDPPAFLLLRDIGRRGVEQRADVGFLHRLKGGFERHRSGVVLGLDAAELDHVGVVAQAVPVGPFVAELCQLQQWQPCLVGAGLARDAVGQLLQGDVLHAQGRGGFILEEGNGHRAGIDIAGCFG